jgi:hypothetical protein
MMPRVWSSALQSPPRRPALERAALAAGVIGLFVIGYFGVGHHTDPARARELATALDHRIPFIPVTIWVYLWVFPCAFIPLFVVRCPLLFRRAMIAYAVTIAVSLIVFVALPVTSRELRVDAATLDVSRASQWAVKTVYDLDPPYNLFPSLHLSIAVLAALAAWNASRRYGAITFIGVALVGVSITTVKQHFVIDGLAGIALAALVQAIVFRGFRPSTDLEPAYSWRGPALYVVLLALAYGGFYAAFLWAS